METLGRYFAAMGTDVHLVAMVPDAQQKAILRTRLDDATAWLQRVEATLTRFSPESELSRLNAVAGSPCWVSPLLSAVLEVALEAAGESGGLYDPTVLPCIRTAGYDATLARVLSGPAPEAAPARGWRPSWNEVALDRRYQVVTLPAGTGLDFGGIAKGWAADCIAAAWPAELPLVVGIGGDLRIHLPPSDTEGWPVTVEDPFRPGHDLARLVLPAGGVATSSTMRRRWYTRQGWRHHLIDPRTGRPAETDVAQVTVVAPTAARAEAWAKAVCILGSREGLEFLARRAGAGALIVRRDGTCLATPDVEVYLDGFYGESAGD